MKPPKITLPIATLTTANLVPLAGVLLLGWDVTAILLLYWAENVAIGFYNILKMAIVRVGNPLGHLGKLFLIPFFCIHFGGFCAGHGLFLLIFLKLGSGHGALMSDLSWPGPLVFLQMLVSVIVHLWQSRPDGMEWPVICLFVSHGISFVRNYLSGKEYASQTMERLMKQPYRRIVLLHIAIIAGGMPVMVLGSPIPLLFILVGVKIGLDIWLHTKEHSAPQPETADRSEA